MATQLETIRILIEKIVYRDSATGFTILRTDRGSAKGTVAWEPKPDDALRVEGVWKTSAYNGAPEFVFKTAMVDVPENKRALLTYAVSITDGMGEATADKIWARYGEAWTDARDLDIKGLTAKARDCWVDTLRRIEEQREQATAVAFLVGHNCTLNLASVAWGAWTKSTISVVMADPFALASLPQYGFKTVDDEIRKSFGIEDGDPRRAAACVKYLLNENAKNGNTVAGIGWLSQRLMSLVPVAPGQMGGILDALVNEGAVILFGGQWISRSVDFQDETTILKRFQKGEES